MKLTITFAEVVTCVVTAIFRSYSLSYVQSQESDLPSYNYEQNFTSKGSNYSA